VPARWGELASRCLFIAGLAFPNAADYAAAKIAIFIASVIAAVLGTIILYPRRDEETEPEVVEETDAVCSAFDSVKD
jgi:hypothetical protein